MPKDLRLPRTMPVLENGVHYGLVLHYADFKLQAVWSATGTPETGPMSLAKTRRWLAEHGYTCHELPPQC
ncbi:hypothetical protein [Nonomuraea wenchangensis]|uniref:Uncharacterized protein n=1 Tax=Nonomuraea wenchangensis TaxID=568860 RepID=A0A1I0EYV2_9ACTN|nr:hypothetical protein [Nonomuraea wenchangensis]SET50527.1 hypothetical protein SAMN05421811_103253 [Nonomuraea wenchangensis]